MTWCQSKKSDRLPFPRIRWDESLSFLFVALQPISESRDLSFPLSEAFSFISSMPGQNSHPPTDLYDVDNHSGHTMFFSTFLIFIKIFEVLSVSQLCFCRMFFAFFHCFFHISLFESFLTGFRKEADAWLPFPILFHDPADFQSGIGLPP